MYNFRTLFATLAALALLPAAGFAQNGTVSGTVTAAEDGSPLPGAQVAIQGSVRRAVTGQQGRYEITGVSAGTHVVDVSLLGRASGNQTVTVVDGQTATANFNLAVTSLQLEGIVVNAITGQRERVREVGTNVATIEVDDIAKGPINNFADVLTGRTAGVNLQGVAGSTGTSQKIRIRGANSLSLDNEPLIYVDGILFSNNKGGIGVGGQDYSRLNDINAEDISTVEVLKGPAASALYGTAAANGVLLITTKRGRSGAPQYRVYGEVGSLEDRTDYPTNFFTFQRNAQGPIFIPDGDFRGLINDATGAGVVTSCPNRIAATGECRQDETITFNSLEDSRTTPFSTGNRNKVGLSVSGGSDNVQYYLSGDREGETGVIDYNTLDKVNVRANLTAQLGDKADFQVSSGYVNSNLTLPSGDNSIFSPLINGLLGTPQFLEGDFEPTNNSNFGFGFTPEDLSNLATNQDIDRFIIGLSGNYRPFSWLATNANVGLDYFSRSSFETLQPGRLPIGGAFTLGFRDARRASNYLYTGSTSATSSFELSPRVASTTTVGTNYRRELFDEVECFGAGIVEGTRSCGASSSLFEVDEDFSEIITLGGFLSQQFALNDRLFVTGSLRGDDNSAFGSDFGFILYPAANISWVLSDEPWFIPEQTILSNLRLRAGIGTSGLRPNFRDAVTLFAPVSVQQDAGELSAVTIRSTGNLDLEPEKTTEYELGADVGLLTDRVSAEFTYYNKESTDALISRPLAPSFGLTSDDVNSGSIFQNLGSIRNSGIELGLNVLAFDREKARLNLRVSATTLDNQIEDLGRGVEPIIFNRGAQRHQEGFPAGSYFQRPFTFNDANRDGKLSIDEVSIDTTQSTVVQQTLLDGTRVTDTIPEVFLGQSLPTNSQSLAADLTLFQYITFSTLFDRRAGFQQLNDTESFRCGVGDSRRNSSGKGGCVATGDPNASLEEQARFIADRFLGTAAGFVEDADFVKWREFSVALGVPPGISRTTPLLGVLEGATLTLSGRNLATWTDYSGLDPEINETGGDSNFTQGEFNTQPPVRYFTARLDLTF